MTGALANGFGLQCPNCGDTSHIDVRAQVWVRLFPDGTDPYAAHDQHQGWHADSRAFCATCKQRGTVAAFTPEDQT